jgi:hypothetical protein
MFPLLARWNGFAVTPMEEPLDGSVTRAAYRGANRYREHIRGYNSAVALASVGAEFKSPPGIVPHCFRIHDQI